ncbi:hypothetical protein CRYUN_Cryun34aG0055500 [Craigia yunnanensis]
MQGKMSCLMINEIEAGLGRFSNTRMTVNNQIVVGTLMNLSDNPTRVSIGQDWQPTREDIVNIVYRMYEKDGISKDEVVNIVDKFPNQECMIEFVSIFIFGQPWIFMELLGLEHMIGQFQSGLRVLEELKNLNTSCSEEERMKNSPNLLLHRWFSCFVEQQVIEALLESGYSLLGELQLIMETKLSKEYMKNIDD